MTKDARVGSQVAGSMTNGHRSIDHARIPDRRACGLTWRGD